MRRLVPFAIALFLCATPALATDFDRTHALCPGLAKIDLASVSAMTFDVAGARKLLGAKATPDLGDADAVLRFYQLAGFGPAPYTIEATARRIKGRWNYARTRKPGREDTTPRQGIETVDGWLPAGTGSALDAALADPCLALEPDFAPRTIPLIGGSRETCLDGGLFLLQVERADGARIFRQECATRWGAGEIMMLLRNAVPEPASPPTTR